MCVCGQTALMAILALDPAGRDLFEHWHYEDLHHHEDLGAGLPAAIEDTFEVAWQDGPSFYDLQGTHALRVDKDHVSGSMTRDYV